MKKPREIYLYACDQIAADLNADGFKYARSGPHLTRERGDWKDKIVFQSSHHNATGSVVKLWIHICLANSGFRKWRRSVGSPFAEHPNVASAHLGNLRDPPAWLDYSLASTLRRSGIIADAIRSIRELGYPLMQLSADSDSLFKALTSREVAGFEPHDAFEYALYISGRATAGEVLRGCLERRPEFAARVFRDLSRLTDPDSEAPTSPIKLAQLARAIAHHDAMDLLPPQRQISEGI